ncbi:hypothetical protein [Marinicella sp. W31]|uniref:hypothetical protein n=1 Tax=Marinicella sp. W31 TaxID=3023713 RepID=UPI003756BDAC
MKMILVLLFIFTASYDSTAQGLQVPCLDCDKYERNVIPKTGFWGNIQQPGAGFNFEIQKGILVGSHFAYDENGKQTWYLFSGLLVPSNETNMMWAFEAEMDRFENGQCVNCEYSSPVQIPNQGNIKINFHQMGSASYTIDDGERVYIVPFLFGIDGTNRFSPATEYQFPDLTGTWVFVTDRIKFGKDGLIANQSDKFSFVALIALRSSIENNEKIEVVYAVVWEEELFGDVSFSNEIRCTALKNNTELGPPECVLNNLSLFGFLERDFLFPLGNITENRLFGESDNGESIEAFRTKYTIFREKTK